ncbi:Uncharacterised protein [Klebsiella pneumoniae]|nr:Uncharacterised protein [Klebsiella pneumoniae]
MFSALSPSNPTRTTSRWGLYVSIVLIGANLRAPITSLGPVLPDIQRALHLGGLGRKQLAPTANISNSMRSWRQTISIN